MSISIENAINVTDFVEGILISYKLQGHIIIRFKKISGSDAVLSAIYFD